MSYSALQLNGITAEITKEGIVTVSVPVEVETLADAVNFDISTLNLDISLPYKGTTIRQLENGSFQLTYQMEGVVNNFTFNADTGQSFELEFAGAQEPIQTNPNFDTKLRVPFKAVFEKNTDGTDGDFLGFSRTLDDGSANPLYGVDSYLTTGCVWRRTYASYDFPEAAVAALGKIDVPVDGIAKLPPTPSPRNWLKTSCRASWRGNIWQITEEWTLSGDRGWDKNIYSSAS